MHCSRKAFPFVRRHVVTELLKTEQVYVEELRIVIEVSRERRAGSMDVNCVRSL